MHCIFSVHTSYHVAACTLAREITTDITKPSQDYLICINVCHCLNEWTTMLCFKLISKLVIFQGSCQIYMAVHGDGTESKVESKRQVKHRRGSGGGLVFPQINSLKHGK